MRVMLLLTTLNCLIAIYTSIYIKAHLVFDIDTIRRAYLQDTQLAFTKGCNTGTEYPEEWKKPTTEFNQHSPAVYCADEWNNIEEYFFNTMLFLDVKRDNK